MQIYDGKDKTTHLLGAFTGASMRGLTLSSTSNQLWLEFNSDSEGTDEGFQLVYTSKYLLKINCQQLNLFLIIASGVNNVNNSDLIKQSDTRISFKQETY